MKRHVWSKLQKAYPLNLWGSKESHIVCVYEHVLESLKRQETEKGCDFKKLWCKWCGLATVVRDRQICDGYLGCQLDTHTGSRTLSEELLLQTGLGLTDVSRPSPLSGAIAGQVVVDNTKWWLTMSLERAGKRSTVSASALAPGFCQELLGLL